MSAFSEALALESAGDLKYVEEEGSYVVTGEELVRYARIVAYRVVRNVENGHVLSDEEDPLCYEYRGPVG